MKRLLSIVVLLLVVFAPSTYADSIPTLTITYADVTITPLFIDTNARFIFAGPGTTMTNLSGLATVNPPWSDGFVIGGLSAGLFPGSSLNPSGFLFIDFVEGSVNVGGQTLTLCFDCLGRSSITALGSFQFPTNGESTFTVTVPAMLEPTSGIAQGPFFDRTFQLKLPRGSLTLNFDLFPAQDPYPAYYQFSHGEFFGTTVVPEPGTLGLMVTGLAGVIGVIRRKRSIRS
jgi:PEP-CTERM motif